MYFEPDGEFPDHEPNPLLEENRRMIMERVTRRAAPTSASPGTATPTAASSSTPAASSATATSSAPCSPARPCARTRARRSSTTPAPAAPCRTWSPPRAGARTSPGSATPSSRRGCARRSAAFGGEVSGHYYFRDFWNADSGTIPALLMLELLSVDGRGLGELMDEFRSKYFISGEINSEVADPAAKMEEIAERYADGEITRLDGDLGRLRRTGTSTCAPPTPSRCCASTSSRWSRARTWSAAATRSSG